MDVVKPIQEVLNPINAVDEPLNAATCHKRRQKQRWQHPRRHARHPSGSRELP
tara:strand:- start:69 stop:227 length:159 start_codon:yes stop_codon:yes gene_type:complete